MPPDRDAAIDRLARAIAETEIGGIQTTLPFHAAVARSESFREAELSTGWVDEHWDGETARADAVRKALVAAGLAALDGAEPRWTARRVARRRGRPGRSQRLAPCRSS